MSDLGSKADINDVYTERNRAVALACELAHRLGYHTEVYHGDIGEEPEWVVVFIDLPTGQVSWHIPAQEYIDLFPAIVANLNNSWDGHSTDDKNSRIQRFTQRSDEMQTEENPFGSAIVDLVRREVRAEMAARERVVAALQRRRHQLS